MTHRLRLALLSAVLAGCSTTAVRVASIDSPSSSTATFELLRFQAYKCWPSTVTAIKKGIAVGLRPPSTIEAYPVHWGYGVERKRPFVVVTVAPAGTGSNVTVDEGPHSCTVLQGCPMLGLKQDVENWLNGDLSCKDISSQLIRLGVGV